MCDQVIRDGTLVCIRPDPHDRGHVFAATAGPDLDNGSAGTPKRHADCEVGL